MTRHTVLYSYVVPALAALAAAIFVTAASASACFERHGVTPCGATQVFE